MSRNYTIFVNSASSPDDSEEDEVDARGSEVIRKEIEEDAAKAGYNDVGQFLKDSAKKHPGYLEAAATSFKKCAEKHGAEGTECKVYKECWLESKAVQNA